MTGQLGKQIGSGAGSDVYEYGDNKVCKLYKTESGSIQYEFEKTLRAFENGLPVPKVYEILKFGDRFGIIMDRITGTSFMDLFTRHIAQCHEIGMTNIQIFQSPLNIELIRNMAKALYDLHQIQCDAMESGKVYLTNSCTRNMYLSQDEKKIIYALIEQLPDGDCVCHGDPNPGNFITQENQVYLIDWCNSVKSSPLFDLTEYALLMEYADVSVDMPDYMLSFIRTCKDEFVKTFHESYISLSGVSLSDMDRWILPLLVSKMNGNNSVKKQQALLSDIKARLRAI